MAGKIKRMSTIKQLLILHGDGRGIKYISRHTGMSKNTVKRYLLKVKTLQCSKEDLLKLDDPQLEARFHGGNPSYSDDRHSLLLERIPYFMDELKKKGVTRHLLWEEYCIQSGSHYSYSQFCYHLQQYSISKKATMVLHHEAGDKVMIDFAGKKMNFIDPESAEMITCNLYIAVLPFSNYCYVEACRTQELSDFIHCTANCLRFLGGSPKALVTDNLKCAVIRADKYEPAVNNVFEQFGNHYGSVVLPARAYKPKDKAAVENMVKIVYTHVMAKLRHRQFFSLSELNKAISEQVFLLNQRRMQNKEFTREEQFNAAEKPFLKPLPDVAFEIQYTKTYKVALNNHFCLTPDKHYYSVPHTLIGQKVVVIYTRSAVRIYHKGTLICVHARDTSSGKYTTQAGHLCSHHRAYNQRSPDYYKQRALTVSPVMHQLVGLIFDQPDKYPEQLYKTCDGLLNLARIHKSDDRFDKACQIGIEQAIYSYAFIKRILDNNMTEATPYNVDRPLPKHNNIRGRQYYQLKLF
jgi:transposase